MDDLGITERDFPGMTVTAYEHIVQLHEISLVQDEWQYPVQEHAEHTRSPNWSPIFITYSDDNVELIPTLHSDSVWNALRPLWINYVTRSFDWKGLYPELCRPILWRDFSHGCGRMVGFFPNSFSWIQLKKVSKNALMSHSIGLSKGLQLALAPSSVVIMAATGSKFSTLITYLSFDIVCNIISTSILNRVRWKQALS